MKVLHREVDSCMSCPFLAIVGDTKDTIIACKNREAAPDVPENATVIKRQPMDHVIADVEIPDWCPLPDSQNHKRRNELRQVIKMILCDEFAGIGEELVDNIEEDILKAVASEGSSYHTH